MGEAGTRSVVSRRRLTVYLAICSGGCDVALGGTVGFNSVFRTRDLIALDLDGRLRFGQVLVQLLEGSTLLVNLFVQVIDVLEQELFLRFYFAQSGLVLGKIIKRVFVRLVEVCDLAVLLQELLSVALDLFLQTPNVTLEFSKSSPITALFETLGIRR